MYSKTVVLESWCHQAEFEETLIIENINNCWILIDFCNQNNSFLARKINGNKFTSIVEMELKISPKKGKRNKTWKRRCRRWTCEIVEAGFFFYFLVYFHMQAKPEPTSLNWTQRRNFIELCSTKHKKVFFPSTPCRSLSICMNVR